MIQTAGDLDAAIALSNAAVAAVVRGDPRPIQELYSHAEDVTLGNPFGPFVRGRHAVEATTAAAAARYRDGELTGVEELARHESEGLACVVAFEHARARLGESTTMSTLSLRVTSVYRQEAEGWRLVHRHADPITTPRGTESLVEQS